MIKRKDYSNKTFTVTVNDEAQIESIKMDSDGASIPIAIGNRNYQEFLIVQENYPENITSILGYQYTDERKWVSIRSKRDQLLTACDWTQLPDSPKYQDEQWLIYRQALRDITNQFDPDNIIWPIKPEE